MATCPACDHRFTAWGVIRISRWTCLTCPSCGALLNRRIYDRQSVLLLVFALTLEWAATILLPLRWGWFFFVALIVIPAIVWLADVFTVQLREVRNWRRFTGYEV